MLFCQETPGFGGGSHFSSLVFGISPQWRGPFVRVVCLKVDESLLFFQRVSLEIGFGPFPNLTAVSSFFYYHGCFSEIHLEKLPRSSWTLLRILCMVPFKVV